MNRFALVIFVLFTILPTAELLLGGHLATAYHGSIFRIGEDIIDSLWHNHELVRFDFCTATFISYEVLITVKHCFHSTGPNIRVKLTRANGKEYFSAAKIYFPESIYKGDLALVVLKKALPRSEDIEPMQIDRHVAKCGDDVVLYGYGFSDTRHGTFFGLMATLWDELTDPYLRYLKTRILERNCYEDDFMKTKVSTGTGCIGDSGGPLLKNGRIIGILTGGTQKDNICAIGYENQYTRISAYVHFIKKFVQIE